MALVGVLAATGASAQTPATTGTPSGTPPVVTPMRPGAAAPMTTAPMTTAPMATAPMTTAPGPVVTRTPAAPGDHNPAVATTAANAPQPAHGHNSFTQREAMRRMGRNGYTQVTELKKDTDGVWRGKGMKDGGSVGVWLDYKGNVGQQ